MFTTSNENTGTPRSISPAPYHQQQKIAVSVAKTRHLYHAGCWRALSIVMDSVGFHAKVHRATRLTFASAQTQASWLFQVLLEK